VFALVVVFSFVFSCRETPGCSTLVWWGGVLGYKETDKLDRLIKAGELSTCSGERNAKMVDNSELLRVFGPFEQPKGEHQSGQVSGQRDTASADQGEQVIRHRKQEIEHLKTLLLSKDSQIDSLKQAMLLLEKNQEK
ncbi:hypothetical protein, partial [Klebsiella pneumoniae]|uniref:hypothetical protein n=1 Tax=Klebsiella pneumoniae TaxID=573 RepID=UPI001F4B26F2